jgi:hypothetical protein
MLSFRVPGATSEKFVLAIILLDALLHSQGQEASSAQPAVQCIVAASP